MVIAGVDLTEFLGSVAAQLAHMGADQQAEFFNIFAKELEDVCGTAYGTSMQVAYIADGSSKEFKEFCAQVSYEEGS